MTEPTDAELEAFAVEEQFLLFCDVDEFTQIARAVIAKWGTPPEVEGEPVAWRQGSLTTVNQDPYPSLGDWFVQFWEGDDVAARVYGNDMETLRRRCAVIATPQPTQAQAEKCAVCGDGNARLVVMRSCDVCGSDYAGQSESEVNVALERARKATQAQAGAVPLTPEQITAAAKKLAECMDYPWEHMPEQGRAEMRKHAQAVLAAANGSPPPPPTA